MRTDEQPYGTLLILAPVWLVAFILSLGGCTHTDKPDQTFNEEAYRAQIKQWRADRIKSLKADDGWLNLAGLFWLEKGTYRFGSDPSNDLVFPDKAAGMIGTLRVADSTVSLKVNDGVAVTYRDNPVERMKIWSETQSEQLVLSHGSLRFFIIERDQGRLAVRLRDLDHPNLQSFDGLEYFPIDTTWRVKATFVPYRPAKTIEIPTVYGTVRERLTPGALEFSIEGTTYSLDPVVSGEDDPFFVIFSDETNGETTYSGGRFLYVKRPGSDGTTVIDFNKAYSPPCAFTEFATCPLPPADNRFSLEITAGEKTTTLNGH